MGVDDVKGEVYQQKGIKRQKNAIIGQLGLGGFVCVRGRVRVRQLKFVERHSLFISERNSQKANYLLRSRQERPAFEGKEQHDKTIKTKQKKRKTGNE